MAAAGKGGPTATGHTLRCRAGIGDLAGAVTCRAVRRCEAYLSVPPKMTGGGNVTRLRPHRQLANDVRVGKIDYGAGEPPP